MRISNRVALQAKTKGGKLIEKDPTSVARRPEPTQPRDGTISLFTTTHTAF
jgi:hypothetical protein